MRKDVSRRRALSLLGIALGVALASMNDAEAQATGTKSRHTKHPKPTVQPASAPAAPSDCKNIQNQTQYYQCRATGEAH
jgi:hypothetical protein